MKEQMKEREKVQIKRKAKRVSLREKGITLIALVVTIIVLLILTGVTLNIALSNNGLFKKAQDAVDKYKKAQEDEEDILEELENQLDNLTSIGDAKASKYEFEKTRTLSDLNGNKVVIPGKFHIASDSGDTVQEGIVIEDSDGNQFVWIPVSNIDGDNDASTEGTEQKEEDLITLDNGDKVEITLGRYKFAKKGETYSGIPTLMQKGSECTNDDDNFIINNYYKENTSVLGDIERVQALNDFVNSIKSNHGYYIARYEASFGSGDNPGTYSSGTTSIMNKQKPIVKKSKSSDKYSMNYENGTLWNYISREDALKVSLNMYKEEDGDEESKYIESDLVNSYAWDTAIVYIQAMGNENYEIQTGASYNDIINTGYTGDVKCNIYDMAGNIREWTSEYCTYENENERLIYVCRGGYYTSDDSTSARSGCRKNFSGSTIGFRPVLYLK